MVVWKRLPRKGLINFGLNSRREAQVTLTYLLNELQIE